MDGPNDWNWTVINRIWRSKRLKVHGLRKWTVLKSKSGLKGKRLYEEKDCSPFVYQFKFPTSIDLSKFNCSFPTSIGSYQLRSVLSNFAGLFPTSAKLSNFRLSNLKLSNFSFFPTALSNYTYPKKSPKKSNLWPGTQDFCLDFVSRNDARWHTQNKFFEIFLDFVSENDARWRTQFLDFVSEICQYGLRIPRP